MSLMKGALVPMVGALVLAGCASGPPCQPTLAVALTSYLDATGTPFVMAGVDGKAAAMLIDTGATTSLLSPSIAERADLQVSASGGALSITGIGGSQTAGLTYVYSFQIGTAVARLAQFAVIDLGGPGGAFATGEDGDIGNDFLLNYDIYLDLPDNRIALYADDACSAVIPPWPGPAISIPLTVGYYGEVYVPITIDGRPMRALLDTGTTTSSIDYKHFVSSGLSTDSPKALQAAATAAIGGTVPEILFQFADMTIGGVHIAKPVLAVELPFKRQGDTDTVEVPKPLQKLLGQQNLFNPFGVIESSGGVILGEDYIQTHRIFISHATQTMFVQP